MTLDMEVIDHGTIIGLLAHSADGRKWLNENCDTEPWMWLGDTLCVEPRYAEAIVRGAAEDGLEIG